MAGAKKERGNQWETRLVTEYVANTYPHAIATFFRMRLGAPPAPESDVLDDVARLNMAKPWMPWADAVVVTDEIILLEGKIRGTSAALGQILHYREILPNTPELLPFYGRPLRCILLAPWIEPYMADLLAKHGIDYANYMPAWINEYIEWRQHYHTAEYRRSKELKEETIGTT